MCAVTTIGSLLVARSYGVTGMLTILLGAVAVIGVGGGSLLFRAKRREWREEEPLDPAQFSIPPEYREIPFAFPAKPTE